MRTLRFSAVLTVFFFAILPAVIGFIVGAAFFVYHILSHLGTALHIGPAFNTWMLTLLHGGVMYAIPSLLLGIVALFLLDRGMSERALIIFSIISASVMAGWAWLTVEFTGPLGLIFVLSLVGIWRLLKWISVPIEQRTIPPVFNLS